MHKEGKDWDFYNKKIVNWKYNPKDFKWNLELGDSYYAPIYNEREGEFRCCKYEWHNSDLDHLFLSKGWICDTKQECEKIYIDLNNRTKDIRSELKGLI